MRRKKSLVDEVSDKIRKYIEKQPLVAGDRLPTEVELLEKYQVSRSVLREAMNRLVTIGLVEVRQGHGMFVGDTNSLANCLRFAISAIAVAPQNLAEFSALRGALECWAARQAASTATAKQVAELEELVVQLDDTERSYDQAIEIDFKFHRKLLEIAGNQLVSNLMDVLQQFVLEGMTLTTPEPRDRDISQRLHRAVVQAIREADPIAAEAAMRTHMEETIRRLAGHSPANAKGQQANDEGK